MNFRLILRFIGLLTLFLGGSMLIPLAVSLYDHDKSTYSFILSIAICFIVGGAFAFFLRSSGKENFSHKDGVAIVTLSWVNAGIIGAIPFLLSGVIHDFTSAYFESMSGFTTTGSTIFSDIESLPNSILLWRSEMQWLGGMGIIVLSIAILPYLGVGDIQLYKAEVPSPIINKLTPRISETAKRLWFVYVSMTAVQIIILLLGKMNFFDAVCHSFSTLPTGGFSPKNASLAEYNSPFFDYVILIFMVLSGISFAIHFKLFKGNINVLKRDNELYAYLVIIFIFSLAVTLDLYGTVYESLTQAFRYASFQIVSIITTTGFITSNYEEWPDLSKIIIFISMFLGGMAGSTAGGIKIMRIILMAKHTYQQILKIIHPHSITSVKLMNTPVPHSVINSIWGFFFLFLGLFVICACLLAAIGLDWESAIGASIAAIGNIGPSFGIVGPYSNYNNLPIAAKWLLSFCMLLGRLEIYTVIVLLVPEFWKK